MLSSLESVDWSSLSHAYGEADDVPDMLRSLLSEEASVRSDAIEGFFVSVLHQGTRYSATPATVPFLIELAGFPTTPDREMILDALFTMSSESDRVDVEIAGSDMLREIARGESRDSRDADDSDDDEAGDDWTVLTQRQIEVGVPVYARFLRDDSPSVRIAAARVLSVCTARPEAVHALRRAMEIEQDATVRTEIILRLAASRHADDAPLMTALLGDDADTAVRLAAALALLWLRAADAAADALRAVLRSAEPNVNAFDLLPRTTITEYGGLEALSRIADAEFGTEQVRVLTLLVESPSAKVREWAYEQLAAVNPPQSAADAVLVRSLSDMAHTRSIRNRHMAMFLIGEAGREIPGAVDALRRLLFDNDEFTRSAAARALHGLAPFAASALDDLEIASRHDEAAARAKDAVERYRNPTVSGLIRLLDPGSRNDVVQSALAQLGRADPQAVVPRLISELHDASSAHARALAEVFALIGPAAESAANELRRYLWNPWQDTRNAVAAALSAICPHAPDPQALPSDPDLLAHLGEDATPQLLRAARSLHDDSNTSRQWTALRRLGRMREAARPAVPLLLKAMEKPWLRLRAAAALACIEPALIEARLEQLLFEDDSAVYGSKEVFTQSLDERLTTKAVEYLMARLPAPGSPATGESRRVPFTMLGLATAPAEAVLALALRVLQTEWAEPDRNLMARYTLGFIGGIGRCAATEAQVDLVAGYLRSEADSDDPGDSLATGAVRTLGRIGSWEAVLPLLDGPLASDERQLQRAAKGALSYLVASARPQDRPVLRAAMTHADPAVQTAARKAMAKLAANPA